MRKVVSQVAKTGRELPGDCKPRRTFTTPQGEGEGRNKASGSSDKEESERQLDNSKIREVSALRLDLTTGEPQKSCCKSRDPLKFSLCLNWKTCRELQQHFLLKMIHTRRSVSQG